MRRTKGGYELSTGKQLDAYCGIVGISDDEDQLYEGYDGYLGEFSDKLSRDEKLEIAEYMIARWIRYKEELK